MIRSLPNRHSFALFRSNSSQNVNEANKKPKRHSLKIITTGNGGNKVRQRLSSLFRTPTPFITSIKEPVNTLNLDNTKQEIYNQSPINIEYDEDNSTTSSENSSSSDELPISPTDSLDAHCDWPEYKPLAEQIRGILGSAIKEVDEEIEHDWEISRNKLKESLAQTPRILT